jgi:hypothetical protein
VTAVLARYVRAVLANDETATDAELVEHFVAEGINRAEAERAVRTRADTLKRPLMDEVIENMKKGKRG